MWAMDDLSLALRSQSLELDQVQGRTDFTQAHGGDVEITGGGQQAGMAEQTLDERQFQTAFNAVGRVGMAQRIPILLMD
jgi:hypothetical protein